LNRADCWARFLGQTPGTTQQGDVLVGVVALLLIIALILGGVALAVHALWWMLIIAGALFLLSAITGMRRRSI
jgi:hypothetical protein